MYLYFDLDPVTSGSVVAGFMILVNVIFVAILYIMMGS
jgi:hypothetical protein